MTHRPALKRAAGGIFGRKAYTLWGIERRADRLPGRAENSAQARHCQPKRPTPLRADRRAEQAIRALVRTRSGAPRQAANAEAFRAGRTIVSASPAAITQATPAT